MDLDNSPLLSVTNTAQRQTSVTFVELCFISSKLGLPRSFGWTFCNRVFIFFLVVSTFSGGFAKLLIDCLEGRIETFLLYCIFLFLLLVVLPATYLHRSFRIYKLHGPVAVLERKLKVTKFLWGSDSPPTAELYGQLAVVHLRLGQLDKALRAYRDLIQEVPFFATHFSGAKVYHEMGRINVALEQYGEAIDLFQEALRCAKLTTDRTRTMRIATEMQAMARTHVKANDLEAALEVANHCLHLVLQDPHVEQNSLEVAKCHTVLSQIYRARKDDAQALKHCQDALDIHLYNEGDFPRSLAVAKLYEDLGSIHSDATSMDSAIESLERALEVYRRAGFSDQHRNVISLLSRLENMSNAV